MIVDERGKLCMDERNQADGIDSLQKKEGVLLSLLF